MAILAKKKWLNFFKSLLRARLSFFLSFIFFYKKKKKNIGAFRA